MSSIVKPLTVFEKTLNRAIALIDLFDSQDDEDRNSDLVRSAVVLSVAAYDHYFTFKFVDVLVPYLKDRKKISEPLITRLREAGLDTRLALELLGTDRPYRRIRTIVQRSLAKHTTQRAEVIDELFLQLSLKDLMTNAQRKTGRKNMLKSVEKIIELRNDIAHDGHVRVNGDPKKIESAEIRRRISDLRALVESCNEIVDNKFGIVRPISE